MEVEKLTNRIKTIALSSGAELVGAASAEQLEEGSPNGHKPSNLLPEAKSVIVLACGRKLNEDRYYFRKLSPHWTINFIILKPTLQIRRKRATRCVNKVARFLENEGHKAVIEMCGWSGILSFKMAAYLAGLGAFGKGGFIIHPKYGPLNVLACIVTNAQLEYGSPLNQDLCGECIECIKACKYGAFKKQGKNFTWNGQRCRVYDTIVNPVTPKKTYGPCNSQCVNKCPIGKPHTK